METTITKPVNEILADEKRAIEGMLGTSLNSGQQVFILAYTPGAIPSGDVRAEARRGIEAIVSENRAFAAERGMTSVEVDDAVAEAMQQTRRRA